MQNNNDSVGDDAHIVPRLCASLCSVFAMLTGLRDDCHAAPMERLQKPNKRKTTGCRTCGRPQVVPTEMERKQTYTALWSKWTVFTTFISHLNSPPGI